MLHRVESEVIRSLFYSFFACLIIFTVYYLQYRFYTLFFYIYPSEVRLESLELLGINIFPGLTPYDSFSIILSSLLNPYYVAYSIGFLIIFILYRNRTSWHFIGLTEKPTRIAICLLVAILTWSYSFYDYNYFFDQFHLFDRTVLIVLNVMIFFNPIYLFLYVPVMFLIMSQFQFMIGEYSLTDKMMVINLILVLNSWVFLNLFNKSLASGRMLNSYLFKNKSLLVTMFCVIVAASYLVPFIAKVNISDYWVDWWLIEDFSIATAAYFDRGWFASVSPELKEWILTVVADLNPYLLFPAFIIEGLAIFLLVGHNTNRLLLGTFVLLHLGIFMLSGIFFWKWILALVVLIFIVSKKREFISRNWKIAGFGMILLSPVFVQVSPLGWYSIPYLSHYYLEVEIEQDDRYLVSGSNMAPYDIFFTFSRWNILDEPMIYGGEWATDPDKYRQLLDLNIDELKKYDKKYGENRYSAERREVFEYFLVEFFKNYNSNPGRKGLFGFLSPPRHIYMSHEDRLFDFRDRVAVLHLFHRRCYYQTAVEKVCDDRLVDSLNIE